MHELTVSPIHGTNGNVEYLARFTGDVPLIPEQREALITQVICEQPDDHV